VLSFAQGQARLQVGYTVMTANPGTTVPVATALFSYTNPAGVLVSQAGVAAAEPIASGRIFVDESGTRTGIALVNPSERAASATLTLRDSAGKELERKTLSLSASRPRVLKVSATTGNCGFGGDGGRATEAAVDCVRLALDKAGNLYIADRINHRVRAVRGPL